MPVTRLQIYLSPGGLETEQEFKKKIPGWWGLYSIPLDLDNVSHSQTQAEPKGGWCITTYPSQQGMSIVIFDCCNNSTPTEAQEMRHYTQYLKSTNKI